MPTLTNLPIVTTATGAMIFPVVDGSSTKQLSLSNLKDYIGTIPTVEITTATSSRLGGVKIGSNISIAGDGTISSMMSTATTSILGGVKGGNNILISSTGTLSFNGGIITGTLFIDNLTPVDGVDTPTQGALLVSGGAGIAGTLGVGNNLVVINTVYASTATVSTLSSRSTLSLSAVNRVQVTQSPFKVWNVSTSTRDTISASNGDIIYNTGNNKFQGYANGVWVDLN